MWKFTGKERPSFAKEPAPGQESVWDYPRPPELVNDSRLVEVRLGETLIARTHQAYRVLETASPPTFYLPEEDVILSLLMPVDGQSNCEWKGAARYWVLKKAPELGPIGWDYPSPNPAFGSIRNALSFYPDKVDCFVDGEHVRPQPGQFYGGWVTDEIVGPVKGEPGTGHW
ncbi:MAG: DUF427 domain-containing protein [Rhodothermales bacterium]